ncbi:hypothetical protein K1719_047086 [Acacia pycnantha]|nr:hypothetical protein K1719_047086 [Acacia pycnantha]
MEEPNKLKCEAIIDASVGAISGDRILGKHFGFSLLLIDLRNSFVDFHRRFKLWLQRIRSKHYSLAADGASSLDSFLFVQFRGGMTKSVNGLMAMRGWRSLIQKEALKMLLRKQKRDDGNKRSKGILFIYHGDSFKLEALYPDVYRNVHEYGNESCKGGLFGQYQGASNHEELHNLIKATVMIQRL